MKITLKTRGATAHLTMRGEFDAFVRPPFVEEIERLVAAGHIDLTLDLRRVCYFGCRALTALLRVRELLRQAGGQLQIERPSPAVRATLEALDMQWLLEQPLAVAVPSRHDSVSEAA